jgi:hypothetical protein
MKVTRSVVVAAAKRDEAADRWTVVGVVGLFVVLWEERHVQMTKLTGNQLREMCFEVRNYIWSTFFVHDDGRARMAELVRVLLTSPKLRWINNRLDQALTNPTVLQSYVVPEAERLRGSGQKADVGGWAPADRVAGFKVLDDW